MDKHFDNFIDAQNYFNQLKKVHNFVCIVYSYDYYTEGYWVEIQTPNRLVGSVINTHDIVEIRNEKINEILNEEGNKDIGI